MKKILLLIDSLNLGGAQRQIVSLAVSLSKDYDVTMVCYHPNSSYLEEEVKLAGIPLMKIYKKSRFDILFILRLLSFIRKGNFDLCISFLDTPNFYNELARIFRAVPRSIVSQRSAYFEGNISFNKKILESMHVFSDALVTNSFTQRERTIKIFPFLKKKTYYIPNSYRFYKEMSDQDANNSTVRFVVVSNTHHYKNALALCQSVVAYKNKFGLPDFVIDWYGRVTESEKDKRQLEEGVALLKKHKLENILSFRGAIKNVYSEIMKSDALIHISNFEGCPNGVCEAMFLKRPVILSNVCDHPMLLNNDNGYLVDQTNADDIALVIRKFVLLDNASKKQMGIRSYEMIHQLMDEEVVYNQWIKLIENE